MASSLVILFNKVKCLIFLRRGEIRRWAVALELGSRIRFGIRGAIYIMVRTNQVVLHLGPSSFKELFTADSCISKDCTVEQEYIEPTYVGIPTASRCASVSLMMYQRMEIHIHIHSVVLNTLCLIPEQRFITVHTMTAIQELKALVLLAPVPAAAPVQVAPVAQAVAVTKT